MIDTVKFCYGCNESYKVQEGTPECPVCSEPLALLPSASTRDIAELEGREALHTARLDSAFPTGDELIGRELGTYSILQFLGKGGMARVYKSRHTTLHRLCALKVLNRRLVARDPRHVSMFLAEARNAAALVHPHVVTVHNIGKDGDYHYIEMEYVDGCSLRRHVADGGPLDVSKATHLITQVCAALAEAHHIGIVHRDIKPGNILVADGRTAKLADFGLAKRVIVGETELEERGLAGTPYFMAPELFDGASASTRSDVYAVGITYYYLLTGKLPFVAQTVGKLAALHRGEAIPDLEQEGIRVDAKVRNVLTTCLAKDAKRRYPDAGALWEEFRSILGDLRDMGLLISEVLERLQFEWEGANGHFAVQVKLPGGRSQRVHIEVGPDEPRLGKLVRIYSICAPLNEGYYRRALELNADMPHGSIAIQNVDGRPHYVMIDTYPHATCDPEEIRRSVLTLARWSDDVERVLTRGDEY